jgi:hypothetical protein
MKFSEQRWFSNDTTLMPVDKLLHILEQAGDFTRGKPVLGGLEDLAEALLITSEYMGSAMPKLPFKELKRAVDGLAVDPLYNEPANPLVNGREFNRSSLLSSHVTYSDPDIKHNKTGIDYNQPIVLYQSLLDLYLADYYPEPGDETVYLGRPYQITTVFFPVNALLVHTGLPLYVAQNAELWRHGDSPPPPSLADAGLPGAPAGLPGSVISPGAQLLRDRLIRR